MIKTETNRNIAKDTMEDHNDASNLNETDSNEVCSDVCVTVCIESDINDDDDDDDDNIEAMVAVEVNRDRNSDHGYPSGSI